MPIEDILFPFTDESHRPRSRRPKPASADKPLAARTVTLRKRASRAIAEPLLRAIR
jgi:hypothetical protein